VTPDGASGVAPASTPLAIHVGVSAQAIGASAMHEVLPPVLHRRVADLLAAIGIPGDVAISISRTQHTSDDHPVLQVTINDRQCCYPDELLGWVCSYVKGEHIDAGLSPAETLAELRSGSQPLSDDAGDEDQLGLEFVALACEEIIKANCTLLLGPSQFAAYRASLPSPNSVAGEADASQADGSRLRRILHTVLELGLSIADRQVISDGLAAAAQQTAEDAAEELVDRLVPSTIEIQLPIEYLRELTTQPPTDPAHLYTFVREGLFVELGVKFPPFCFVPVAHLKPRSFAFRIAHLPTLPLLGLAPEQCLVNETVDRLTLNNFNATAATNPATGQPASVMPLEFAPRAETEGLTTWNGSAHVMLSFAAALRRHGRTAIHRASVQRELDTLAQVFPALVSASVSRAGVSRLTRVLRVLASDEISIRNLRRILERVIDYEGDDDGDVSGLLAFVRRGLSHQLKHKYARATETVVAYLVDPKIEDIVRRWPSESNGFPASLNEDESSGILQAIRSELVQLPRTAQRPVLLTTSDVRERLHLAIRSQNPRLPVIAFDELPPDTNVQPVARISLSPQQA